MGGTVSCLAPGGRTLLSAGSSGNAGSVKEVLEVRPELANYTYFGNSYNVMHNAAALGHLDVLKAVVEVLQNSAADVAGCQGSENIKEPSINMLTWGRFVKDVINARTSAGKTPLMLACEKGHAPCAAYLLEQGADAFAVDKAQRRSAIHYAVLGPRPDVLRFLVSDDAKIHTEDGIVPLRDVRVHDMSGQCRYVDSRAENGLTALHMAAALGDLACVKILLGAGASMMVRTVDLDMQSSLQFPAGSTPLHLAAQRGQIAILQAMLQAHADALGTWGGGMRSPDGQMARRAWEGDGRIDLRSVTNSLRQLPYHVAWQRGFRQAATVLNPTIAIDIALETARDLDDGFGPQKLATLAAYALRRNLLDWLETFKVEKLCAARLARQREAAAEGKAKQKRSISSTGDAPTAQAAALPPRPGTAPAQGGPGLPGPEPAQLSMSPASRRTLAGAGPSLVLDDVLEHPHEDEQACSSEVSAVAAATATGSSAEPSTTVSSSPETQTTADAAGPNARPAAAQGAAPGKSASAAEQPADRHKEIRFEDPGASSSSTHVSQTFASPFGSEASRPFAADVGPSSDTTMTPEEAEAEAGPSSEQRSARQQSAPLWGLHLPHDDPKKERLMSERLQDMERALTGGTGLADPEGSTTSRRSLSVSGARKPSLSIRRTLSSFRRRTSDASQRLMGGDMSRAASIAGFEDPLGDDNDCGICLENELDVAVSGCKHKLCIDCAIRLCEVTKKPPLCPFCRSFIEGFQCLQGCE
ncbi:g96 [Coccomyxa viridis]|uniref:G96 protein n=1 Tax=Coccomyxa viridis TaxID=1274662 RepID=A0ABP1FEW9_9CHLO